MDLAELTAAVDRAFERTGAGLVPWPDPRPDGRVPAEDEYSRCLDPGKYRLLVARADAWAAALVDLDLAAEREVPAAPLREVRDGRRPTRATLLEPATPGALPLLFLAWEEAENTAARVEVHLHGLGILVVGAPVCGCDACDDGSERQLARIDAAMGSVTTGDWLHLELPGARVTATADGWTADGRVRAREVARLLEEARAGRSPHPVVRPGRWW
jgi:hypothetical protein